MKRIHLAGIAAAAMLAAAMPAASQGHGTHHRGMGTMFDFDALDRDGDGRITREEIEAARAERIARLDADGDGVITREELLAFEMDEARRRVEARVDRIMAALDADGDGRITAAEALVRMPAARMADRMFSRLDTDGDGAITRAEFDAMQETMRDRHDRRGGREGRDRMHRHGGDRPQAPRN
ncbi:MAG: EF-hand domain-containing protein [Gemmobacter sp.]